MAACWGRLGGSPWTYASWADWPLTMGDVEEELNLALAIKILSMAVLSEF
jgi:hypothetical protein